VKVGRIFRRFLVPSFVRTFVYLLKYRALVSSRAEVDLSDLLELGRGTEVAAFAKVKALGGPLRIGRKCSIGPGCFLSSGTAGIRIGDHVMIAANTVLVANNHRYDRVEVPMNEQGLTSLGIVVEDDVWIGSNCTILDGSHIEEGCIIAAGSVVSGRIARRNIAAGNPAKRVFERR
jgi:acetyltransferase-like isoleucine patch superfamily enzyme